MKKLFHSFLLSPLILLILGSGISHAAAIQDEVAHATELKRTAPADPVVHGNLTLAQLREAPAHSQKRDFSFEFSVFECEEEESSDKFGASKKFLKVLLCLTLNYRDGTGAHLRGDPARFPHVFARKQQNLPYRYLLFEVFRL